MEINIQNVSMTYPSGKQALQNLSLELRSPSLIGLLGPNGAGKSTLMKLLVAALLPTSGSILVDGQPLLKTERQLKAQLGYLPQDFGLFNELTVAQFLDYMAALKGLRDSGTAVREVIRTVNLEGQARARIRSLSGGQRQRVGIAQALLGAPPLLILDEPTVGLDPEERIHFRNLFSRTAQDRLVLLSTHIIEDIASSCNQVGVINKGILKYHGTPSDMANIAKDVTWTFEVPVRDFAKLPSDMLIVHHIRQGDMIKVRCLSEHKPTETAEKILPALEDSYLWLLRSVKIENKEEIITQ